MNASRAQLVREVIRPALAAGEIVLCDRFYDSTTAYQGYGRQLDMKMVQAVIDIAVGETRPHLTLLLTVPHEISELRRAKRQSTLPFMRDRMEEGDRKFFARVEEGFKSHRRRPPKPGAPGGRIRAGGSRLRKNLGARPAGFAEGRTMVNAFWIVPACRRFEGGDVPPRSKFKVRPAVSVLAEFFTIIILAP